MKPKINKVKELMEKNEKIKNLFSKEKFIGKSLAMNHHPIVNGNRALKLQNKKAK